MSSVTVPVTVRVTVGSDVVDLEDWELFTVLRRKAGLRQEDVAERAGANQPLLSKWERGRIQLPDEKLGRLWEALLRMSAEKRAAEGEAA